MNKLLGNRIQSIRIAKSFTISETAALSGFSEQKYNAIENGTVRITLAILQPVAEALGVSVSDITDAIPAEQDNLLEPVSDMLDLFYANKRLYQKLKENQS